MERFTITVAGDELRGLLAVARLDGKGMGGPVTGNRAGSADVRNLQDIARQAMRDGLATRLAEADLPWARPPSGGRPSAPTEPTRPPTPTVPPSRLQSVRANTHLRVATALALGIASLVLLLGGYGAGWSWTGFQTNNQLWDWLRLLLLPAAFALLPLWLRYSEHMSRKRKAVLASLVVAFWVFVAVGYLVPLHWTGFSGNSLWNWLTLIVLPVTLVTVRAWPTTAREVRTAHIAMFTAIGLAWAVTLIGGYAGTWKWTGYPGNTLWDWLQLLLLPIVFPTILLPAFLRWTSGGAAQRARDAAALAAKG